MKKIIPLILAACVSVSTASAEFRIWKDRNGNRIEAELASRMGDNLIILRDRNGKTHRIDPSKLSDEDQLYLNPPPPKYKLLFFKSIWIENPSEETGRNKGMTKSVNCKFSFNVEYLTDDAMLDGVKGALFVVGEDEKQNFVVIDKVEGPVEPGGGADGGVKGKGCSLTRMYDKDGQLIKGVDYFGFLIVLFAEDGTVLAKECSNTFLEDHEKALLLEVGDRFNKQLEKVDADIAP